MLYRSDSVLLPKGIDDSQHNLESDMIPPRHSPGTSLGYGYTAAG